MTELLGFAKRTLRGIVIFLLLFRFLGQGGAYDLTATCAGDGDKGWGWVGLGVQDFYALFPEKFQNKTNGVTPRRWLAFANPGLAKLITETLGSDNWIKHTDELVGLRKYADDLDFHAKWRAIKHDNKARLAAKIKVCLLASLPSSAAPTSKAVGGVSPLSSNRLKLGAAAGQSPLGLPHTDFQSLLL
jgi:Carbohydrate phosphorylase